MTTVYYIGDSTVARNNIHSYPQTGLSQGLELYLTQQAHLVSLAKNGRSTKSFLDEGRFVPVQEGIRPGDFLLIQFGHNDEKADPARHTDPDTTFRENLRLFVQTARENGAYPVLITPIARRLFDENGVFLPGSHGPYPAAIRAEGARLGVPVIDMTAITEALLAATGDEPSKPWFMWPKDNTHLKMEGAVILAGCLAKELEKLGGVYGALLAPETEGAGN